MAQDRQGSAGSGVDIAVGVGRDSPDVAGAALSATAGGVTPDELPQLDDVFAVIEAELHIDTHDHAVANLIADGFRYFRQQRAGSRTSNGDAFLRYRIGVSRPPVGQRARQASNQAQVEQRWSRFKAQSGGA